MDITDAENTDKKKENRSLGKQYKTLARNSLYSIFNRYGTYVFSLATSFLVARMISKEIWGFLILATSIMGIFTLITSFIPPGMNYSLGYYIPRYRAQNKMRMVKSFILKSLYIRIGVTLFVYSIALFLFLFLSEIFAINLQNYYILLYILSPLIIIENLYSFQNYVMLGFNLFKTAFVLLLIQNFVKIGLLFFFFIFMPLIELELIAFIYLFSSLIPFIVSTFIVITILIKVKVTPEHGLSYKEVLERALKYGGLLSITDVAIAIWGRSEIQVVGLFSTPQNVTGYSISRHYSSVNGLLITSLRYPMIYTISSIDYKEEYSRVIKIYRVVINYTLFMLSLITGILFFCTDFFLSFIYGDSYLIYSTLVKLMIIAPFFSAFNDMYFSLLRAINKSNLLAKIYSITLVLSISLICLGLMYFGIMGAILGIVFSKILSIFVVLFFNFKITKLKFDYSKIILHNLIFFGSLFVSITIGDLFLNDMNYQILQYLNLLFFRNINFLQIILFLIIFFTLHIIFKTIRKSDLEYIELLFTKDKATHRLISKFTKLLSKFLR